jgi:hypothetical protein
MSPELRPMKAHHRQSDESARGGKRHQNAVNDILSGVEGTETLLEGYGQQKPADDLRPSLSDPQFLQNVVPVSVRPFRCGFVPTVQWVGIDVIVLHAAHPSAIFGVISMV